MFEIDKYIKGFFKIDIKEQQEEWEEVFNQMAVHTRMREPVELLLKMRPNEEEYIHKYRLENYRPITYGSMNRALDSVSRILSKIQYNVIAPDNVKKYLERKQFTDGQDFYDFYSFFQKIALKRGIEDPNGWLVWIPTGQGLTDNSVEVSPKPYFFSCKNIHDISEDVCSFLSEEKSEIRENGSLSYDGDVYYILTKNEFYKLVQVSKDKRKKYRLDLIYTHNIGEIPAVILAGDKNAEGYYESFFAPYCAFGDEAINTFSDWQAIKVTSGFPYTEEFYTECELVTPKKTSDPIPEKEQKYKRQMDFQKFPRTPYNTIIRKIPGNKNDGDITGERILPADIPSKRFISPDIEVLKYSGESWEKLIEMAEDALHLNLGNNSNQTEGAKQMDKEEHYAMIDKISLNYFNHLMLNSIKFIDCYINRYIFEKSTCAINTPSTFKLKTEQDIVDEINTLKEKNAPSFFLAEATIELAKRRFNGNPVSKKIFEFISILDPLFIYDVNQKAQLMNSGAITKEAYIKSVYAYSILQKLSILTPNFIEKDINTIQEPFDKELQVYIDSQKEIPLFDPNGTQQ